MKPSLWTQQTNIFVLALNTKKIKAHVFQVAGGAHTARFHPSNSNTLTIGTATGNVLVYDINQNSVPVVTLPQHGGLTTSDLVFSRDHNCYNNQYSAGFDRQIKAVDLVSGASTLVHTCEGPVASISLASDGCTILASTLNGFLETVCVRGTTYQSVPFEGIKSVTAIVPIQAESLPLPSDNISSAFNVSISEESVGTERKCPRRYGQHRRHFWCNGCQVRHRCVRF